MTSYRRGDVVLVPFDFTDRSGSKWRPAVVISGNRYNRETPDVLIASITGKLRAIPHPRDHQLAGWQSAGLLRPSLVQTKLTTIEASLVERKLGRATTADMTAFERGLRETPALGETSPSPRRGNPRTRK